MPAPKAPTPPAPAPPPPLPDHFEAAMDELESIVQSMDDDQVPLESLLEQYARGRQLLSHCQGRLDEAQQRVEQITADPTGAHLTPLDHSLSPTPNRSAAAAGASDDDIRFS